MIDRIGFRMLVIVLLVTAGCSLFTSEPEKVTVESDYNEAFDIVRSVVGARYPIKSASRKKGKIKTNWKEYPSDVKSRRKRLFVNVVEPEDTPNVIRISILSEVQVVESSMKTYRTEQADWDNDGRDRKLEQDLLQIIRFNIRSEEIEKKVLDEVEKRKEREKRLEELKKKSQPPE